MYSNLFSEKSVQDLISILPSLPTALWETFYVTVVSTALSLVLGLPLGVLLVAGEKTASCPCPAGSCRSSTSSSTCCAPSPS